MLIDEGPVDPLALQDRAEGGGEGAFGQPEATRHAAEALHILPDPGADLCLHGLGDAHQQREQSVGRRARGELEMAAVAKLGVGTENVAFPGPDKEGAEAVEALLLRRGEVAPSGDVAALDFVAAKPQGAIKVGEGAAAQDAVPQHREKGRGKIQGEAEGNSLITKTEQHLKQREMRLDDGAVQPILLEAMGHLDVPHPGDMGM